MTGDQAGRCSGRRCSGGTTLGRAAYCACCPRHRSHPNYLLPDTYANTGSPPSTPQPPAAPLPPLPPSRSPLPRPFLPPLPELRSYPHRAKPRPRHPPPTKPCRQEMTDVEVLPSGGPPRSFPCCTPHAPGLWHVFSVAAAVRAGCGVLVLVCKVTLKAGKHCCDVVTSA